MRVGYFFHATDEKTGGGSTFAKMIYDGLKAHSTRHIFFAINFYGINNPQERQLSLIGKDRRKDLIGRVIRGLLTRLPFSYGALMRERIMARLLDQLAEKHALDIVYYPIPQYIRSRVPSVVTVWDLAHRLFPFFPEVNLDGFTWEARESFYRNSLPLAAAVITGTETGRQQAIHHFGLYPPRVKVLPFPVSSEYLAHHSRNLDQPDSRIPSKPYIFYPAQFWAHKNHANLIIALHHLQTQGSQINAVFCGSDQGNLRYLHGLCAHLGLQDNIHFLGFVDKKVLLQLYTQAAALVFPTFFGPDNLPPLEAMALGVPVLASNIDGAKDQLGDAAYYVDPREPLNIAQGITRILKDTKMRSKLVRNGKKLARKRSVESYIKKLESIMDEISSERRTWSNSTFGNVQHSKHE